MRGSLYIAAKNIQAKFQVNPTINFSVIVFTMLEEITTCFSYHQSEIPEVFN